MSKRTRSASEFLINSTLATATKKARGGIDGKHITSSTTMSMSTGPSNGTPTLTSTKTIPTTNTLPSTYEPTSIASLRALVERDGGPTNAINDTRTSQLTTFQRRVYALTKRIPAGRVATYKSLAESLDCPNAYRAVGNALRHNPFAPYVPCHRVVASDGSIGGFAGAIDSTSQLVTRKVAMLQSEGIQFEQTNKHGTTMKTNSNRHRGVHAIKKEAAYREEVILKKIDAKGIDAQLDDPYLLKLV